MVNYDINVDYQKIEEIYKKNHPDDSCDRICQAFQYASKKHEGMTRISGEPYINHPLRTARTVADFGCGSDIIQAALLHDVVEDCDVPLLEIKSLFGPSVADTVDTVTSLSDKDFKDYAPSKEQLDLLSDARMVKRMSGKALWVKIADRIDNLCTMSRLPADKQINKVLHTQQIIIPLAQLAHAWHFVNILEDLCMQVERPGTYKSLETHYAELLTTNSSSCKETLGILSRIFDPRYKNEDVRLDPYHKYLVGFIYRERHISSLFRHITKLTQNYNEDWLTYLDKRHTALYDMFLVVDDELGRENSALNPTDLFFQYYEFALTRRLIYLLNFGYNVYQNSFFFLLIDEMDTLYRLFVKTESEYREYMYGDKANENRLLCQFGVDEAAPSATFNEKVKVFLRNGKYVFIDKGATVLDLAFQIDPTLGFHFAYALLNESTAKLGAGTQLRPGDQIIIVPDATVEPDITWFHFTRTALAVNQLIYYLGGSPKADRPE